MQTSPLITILWQEIQSWFTERIRETVDIYQTKLKKLNFAIDIIIIQEHENGQINTSYTYYDTHGQIPGFAKEVRSFILILRIIYIHFSQPHILK